MKLKLILALAAMLAFGAAQAKLAPPSDEAMAKAAEAKEKTGHGSKVAAYCDLAAEHGLDPSQMALAFAVSRPFVTSVILGATTMAQLTTCMGATGVTISPELEAAIDAIHLRHTNPCP
mgnify:CR=1 FL=1